MKRASFIVLATLAAVVPQRGRATAFAAQRIRSVSRLGRADRSILVGSAGSCASRRRRRGASFGYAPGDFV